MGGDVGWICFGWGGGGVAELGEDEVLVQEADDVFFSEEDFALRQHFSLDL